VARNEISDKLATTALKTVLVVSRPTEIETKPATTAGTENER
jgi:hypothetical protein